MRKTISKNGWNLTREGTREVWLHNVTPECPRGRVVARFKHSNPGKSCSHFVKFLTENFTPVEYFDGIVSGKAPVQVLETKGFVSYNVLQARGA